MSEHLDLTLKNVRSLFNKVNIVRIFLGRYSPFKTYTVCFNCFKEDP